MKKNPQDYLRKNIRLSLDEKDTLIRNLHRAIRIGVRVLAMIMVIVILLGVVDVVWLIFQRIQQPPILILNIGDILQIFGAFLAVLIAIEIFMWSKTEYPGFTRG